MIDEFRAGPLIPDGIGSRPLAMDDSADNPLGAPYLVSTFAPGVREPSAWDPRRSAPTRRLAVLHQRRLALAGPVGGTGSRLDIVDEFDGAYSWWRSAHPEVAETPEAAALARLIRPRLAAAAPAFDGIDYALIHGDLVATNVVVDPSGTPRYIDWSGRESATSPTTSPSSAAESRAARGTCPWMPTHSTSSCASTTRPAPTTPPSRRSRS